MKMLRFITVFICACTLFAGSQALAAWPDKNITLIIPYAAGGTADATGRLTARFLEQKLGVKVVVKNVGGATGTIGAAEVARSRPNGYTLGWYPPGPAVGIPHMRKLPYGKDAWQPLGMMFEEVSFFSMAKDAPWNSVDDVIAELKAKPGEYVMGSSGPGGAVHLSIYSIMKGLGDLQVRHVPERANAEILKAIAGGTTHFMAAQGSELQRFDIKALFVVDDKRSPSFPDIPTAKELGYDIPRITNWYGLFAPAGLPADVLKTLSGALNDIAHDPDFIKAGTQMACTVNFRNAEEFTAFYLEQYDLYKVLIEEAVGSPKE